MIKHFCDVCDNELTEENRIKGEKGRLRSERERPGQRIMVEVTAGLSGSWNAGDFCKYCVIDAINMLDDRPRAIPG